MKLKGIAAAILEELDSSDNHEHKEILFGSAECWLSDPWRKQLTSGFLSNVEFLVVLAPPPGFPDFFRSPVFHSLARSVQGGGGT